MVSFRFGPASPFAAAFVEVETGLFFRSTPPLAAFASGDRATSGSLNVASARLRSAASSACSSESNASRAGVNALCVPPRPSSLPRIALAARNTASPNVRRHARFASIASSPRVAVSTPAVTAAIVSRRAVSAMHRDAKAQ
eukprot:31506-Pelagococcus_subviridis.AAC.8